jgi:hypothetical protein
MSRLTTQSFDYCPDDIDPSFDTDAAGRAADDWLDANPSRGETADDINRWELVKAKARAEFADKWLPRIQMLKQGS